MIPAVSTCYDRLRFCAAATLMALVGCESGVMAPPAPTEAPPAAVQTIADIEFKIDEATGEVAIRDWVSGRGIVTASEELTTDHVKVTAVCGPVQRCNDGILDNQFIDVRFDVLPRVESLRDIEIHAVSCRNCRFASNNPINPSALPGPFHPPPLEPNFFTTKLDVDALTRDEFEPRIRVTATIVPAQCRIRVWLNTFFHDGHPSFQPIPGDPTPHRVPPGGNFAGKKYFDVTHARPDYAVLAERDFSNDPPTPNNLPTARSQAVFVIPINRQPFLIERHAVTQYGLTTLLNQRSLGIPWDLNCSEDAQPPISSSWHLISTSGLSARFALSKSPDRPATAPTTFRLGCFTQTVFPGGPDIQYGGEIEITNNRSINGTVEVRILDFLVDEFMAFEMYAAKDGSPGQTIFQEDNFVTDPPTGPRRTSLIIDIRGAPRVVVHGSTIIDCP